MSAEMEIMNSSSEKIYLTRTPIARVHRYKERKILKVIGASWLQTKITSYFLVAICVFGIVAIIFAEIGSYDIFVDDGNYAATVFWKSKTGFRIEFWGQGNDLNEVVKGCGRAYYRPDMPNTGWSVIEIETNEQYPDWTQAFAAGFLEGSLTWQAIYWQHENTIQPFCEQNEVECEEVRSLLRENSEEIREKAKRLGKTEPFWHQIDMFYIQLDGLATGWNYAVKRSRQSVEIDPIDFLWLNTMSMWSDLDSDNRIENTFSKNLSTASTAFISFLQSDTDGKEIYVAHNSAGRYNLMLRLIKRYKFHYHPTQNDTTVVPGNIVTFTSYPGSLTSQDEFYLVTSDSESNNHNLIVTGSSISAPRKYLLDSLNAENNTLLAPRLMAANRLATNGENWAKIINSRSSHSENMQWTITDLTGLDSEKWDGSGLLWVVEQYSGKSNASDQSAILARNGYWTNMVIPDYHSIEDVIKTPSIHDNQNFKYSNQNIPSEVNIFEKHPRNCTTLDNIIHLMHNTTSLSNSVRGDLSSENPQLYGVIDTKIIKGMNHGIDDFIAISGPPFSNQMSDETSNTAPSSFTPDAQHSLPFQWSTSAFNLINHLGHPDIWNFKNVHPKWIWI